MKQLFLLITLLMVGFQGATAASRLESDWEKGNAAFLQKQYDTAIVCYQRIIAAEPNNAIAYYNLGNAYYRHNEVSNAALSYERALFYDPQMSTAKDNLLLAQSRIPNTIVKRNDIFFLQWWQQMTAAHRANFWALSALILFLSYLIFIWFRTRTKARISLPVQFYFLSPILIAFFIIMAYFSAKNSCQSDKAVVMQDGAALTIAPDNYKGQRLIPEATTVNIEATQGNWYSVSLPDKKSGWMKKSDLSLVQPHNP